MQLTFDTEKKANEAAKQAWIDYVKEKHVIDKRLVGTGEVEYDSLDGLSDDEIANLKVYSIKNGEIMKKSGLTTNYSTPRKADKLDKWYFKKPPSKLAKNIKDATEEELNDEWVKKDLEMIKK